MFSTFIPKTALALAATFVLALAASAQTRTTAFDGNYPRLFVTPADKASLKQQIADVEFKHKAFENMVSSVQKYVDRHQTDPQWILSRIPLNRTPGKRYTGYIYHPKQGSTPSYFEGYGDAPVPTLRYQSDSRLISTGRDKIEAAPLEDVTPNATDSFNVVVTDASGKKTERRVSEHDAGLTFGDTFNKIRGLARTSAYLYWLTGDEKYARFASDILLVIADSAANVTERLKSANDKPAPAPSYNYPVGNVFSNSDMALALAQGMDYLHDYFIEKHTDLTNYEKGMKLVCEFIGKPTSPHNINVGANLAKLELVIALKGDKVWSQPKLDETLDSITKQAKFIDQNGVWIEPCAYSDYTIAWFMKFLYIGYNNRLDVLDRYPQIFKSGTSQLRDLFPNCVYMGDGDSWSPHPRVWVIEPALTLARRTGNTSLEKQLSQYISLTLDNGIYKARGDGADSIDTINVLLPELKYPSTGTLELAPSVRNASRESLVLRKMSPAPAAALGDAAAARAERNKYLAEHSLQATMYGTMEGTAHRHMQGITIDLYGCGNALGLDPGPGEDAYNGPVHNGFSTRYAAHNTVVVDGKSTGYPDMTGGVMEPEDAKTPVSASFSFMKGDSVDPDSKKPQSRLVSVVRTSPTSGYYVDIFHSAGAGKNEYLYHNVGTSLDVLSDNNTLSPTPAPDELSDDDKRDNKALVGYRFLSEKQTYAIGERDIEIRFNTPYKDQPEPVHMSLFLPGALGRTLISAMSPGIAAHRAYGGYVGKPIPTIVLRQNGEAWNHPFTAVFEPYRASRQTVRAAKSFAPSAPDSAFTGLRVESASVPGTTGPVTDRFFTATSNASRFTGSDWAFKGLCAAVRTIGNKVTELYLGSGSEITSGPYRLLSTNGGDTAASLTLRGDQLPRITSSVPLRITLPLPSKPVGTPTLTLREAGRVLPATDISVTANPENPGTFTLTATVPATTGAELVMAAN